MIREARAAVDEGFEAIKFDPFHDGDTTAYQTDSYARMIKSAAECVGAVREAVGWDVDIAIEGHRKLGPGEAVDFGRELEPYRVFMYEDALPIDSLAACREIAPKISLPVGLGERNDTIWEFRELLEDGVAQFVRPDVGLAGGFTACMKIAAMAEAYHAQLLCHNYTSPLLTAATLQLYAAVSNVATFEYTLLDEREPPHLAAAGGPAARGRISAGPAGSRTRRRARGRLVRAPRRVPSVAVTPAPSTPRRLAVQPLVELLCLGGAWCWLVEVGPDAV